MRALSKQELLHRACTVSALWRLLVVKHHPKMYPPKQPIEPQKTWQMVNRMWPLSFYDMKWQHERMKNNKKSVPIPPYVYTAYLQHMGTATRGERLPSRCYRGVLPEPCAHRASFCVFCVHQIHNA